MTQFVVALLCLVLVAAPLAVGAQQGSASLPMERVGIREVLSACAIIVSVISFAISFWYTRRTSISAKKPVLAFVYDAGVGWMLRNIGNGPALNIVAAQKRAAKWFNPVRLPPLARDKEFPLVWLGHVNDTGLGATYTDDEDRPYTSTCGNDLSRVLTGNHFPAWQEREIGRHWNQPVYRSGNAG